MNGFEKYSRLFVEKAKKLLDEEKLAEDPEYKEAFINHLLGLKGPKQLERKNTPADVFFSAIYNGYVEISTSYYCRLDIEIYIGRFPYSNTKISKSRHLLYNFENYLHEVYILKERLLTHLTKVGRLYRKNPNHNDILKTTKPLFKAIRKVFKGIIITRGAHVHKARFYAHDLDRLNSLELLVQHDAKELQMLKNFYKLDYSAIRRKYKNIIKDNNKGIKDLLDLYFDVIYTIVTDPKGNFDYPKGIKA